MDADKMLRALTELAESLAIDIRRVPGAGQSGDSPGGAIVRIRGRQVIFLDSAAPIPDQVHVVAAALAGRKELEEMFLPPEIRQRLEQFPADP